jgi:hypothetical protein
MSQQEHHKAPKEITLQRALRHGVIDARITNDLNDDKARKLLDVLAGTSADNQQSDHIYHSQLKRTFFILGACLSLFSILWLILLKTSA